MFLVCFYHFTKEPSQSLKLTDESVWYGNFEPHAITDLQARLRLGHGSHYSGHVCVHCQVHVIP